jgi:hypothetical protein
MLETAKQLDSMGGDRDDTFIAYVESQGIEEIDVILGQLLPISNGRYENWLTVYSNGIMTWSECKDYAATRLGFGDLIEEYNG